MSNTRDQHTEHGVHLNYEDLLIFLTCLFMAKGTIILVLYAGIKRRFGSEPEY